MSVIALVLATAAQTAPATASVRPSAPPAARSRAPAPSPPDAHPASPAAPRFPLASYVGDYPAAALRNGEQGDVAFRLHVGADGLVTRCEVTGSSGSSALDAATCRTLRARARFRPARDEAGRAVADTHRGRIVWRLPDAAPAPAAQPPRPRRRGAPAVDRHGAANRSSGGHRSD